MKNNLKDLESELSRQNAIYCTSKDLNKANEANWQMTLLLMRIMVLKQKKV
jgi:hypothetical protein